MSHSELSNNSSGGKCIYHLHPSSLVFWSKTTVENVKKPLLFPQNVALLSSKLTLQLALVTTSTVKHSKILYVADKKVSFTQSTYLLSPRIC